MDKNRRMNDHDRILDMKEKLITRSKRLMDRKLSNDISKILCFSLQMIHLVFPLPLTHIFIHNIILIQKGMTTDSLSLPSLIK